MKRAHLRGAALAAALLFGSTTLAAGSGQAASATPAVPFAATPTVTEDGNSLQLTGSWVETIGDVTRIGTVILNTFDKRSVTHEPGAAPVTLQDAGMWIYTQVFDYTCPPGELPESGTCSYTAMVGETGEVTVAADKSLSLATATGTLVVAPVGDAAEGATPTTIALALRWEGVSELGSSSNRNTYRRGDVSSISTADTQQRDTSFSGRLGTTIIDTATSNGSLYSEAYSTTQRG